MHVPCKALQLLDVSSSGNLCTVFFACFYFFYPDIQRVFKCDLFYIYSTVYVYLSCDNSWVRQLFYVKTQFLATRQRVAAAAKVYISSD